MTHASGERGWSFRTRAAAAAGEPDAATQAVEPPIVVASSFVTEADTGFSIEDQGVGGGFIYSRWGNPTVARLEARLADLETGEAAVCFASGMGAVHGLFMTLLKSGDHLVVSEVAYAGVVETARHVLPGLGIEVSCVDTSDLEQVEAALRPNTRLVLVETPANPIARLSDIDAIAALTKKSGAALAVDSTWGSPAAIRPLERGADYVVHSLTKYIGGHGDALGGAIVGARDAVERLRQRAGVLAGAVMNPFAAYLILRGVATLPLRMRAHSEGAQRVAEFLEGHAKVERVLYPGLDSHPQRALAERQLACTSGMLAFRTADGPAMARRLRERLRLIHYAVSLGHYRSLVFYIGTDDINRTSFGLRPESLARYRELAGDGIFRLSVGLEDPEDLCRDLEAALG